MLIVLVSVFSLTIKTLNTSLTRYLLSLSPQHPLGLEKMSLRSGLIGRLYSKTSIQGKFLGQEKSCPSRVVLLQSNQEALRLKENFFFSLDQRLRVLNKKFQIRNFQRQRFVPSVAAQLQRARYPYFSQRDFYELKQTRVTLKLRFW